MKAIRVIKFLGLLFLECFADLAIMFITFL